MNGFSMFDQIKALVSSTYSWPRGTDGYLRLTAFDKAEGVVC